MLQVLRERAARRTRLARSALSPLWGLVGGSGSGLCEDYKEGINKKGETEAMRLKEIGDP
jgi:hypothetical protein